MTPENDSVELLFGCEDDFPEMEAATAEVEAHEASPERMPCQHQTTHDDEQCQPQLPVISEIPATASNSQSATPPAVPSTSAGTEEDRRNLEQYISSKRNKSTVRKTDCNFKRFQNWLLNEKNETMHPLEMVASKLDCYIGSFLLCITKEDGSSYEPDTLTSFHRSIARKLEELGSHFNLVKGTQFSTSRKVLEAKRRELKQDGFGNRQNKADALSEEQENKLWEVGQLGVGNPKTLQNTVWFWNTKLLGLRGAHESRQLKWGDLILKVDDNNKEYLEFNERETKTRTGNSTHLRPFQPKIFTNETNLARCPVMAYKTYRDHRPQNMCQPHSPFYLAINYKWEKTGNWFKNSPLGADSLTTIMKGMAQAAKLSGHITNHSIRKAMCSQLLSAGVNPITVIQLSGHKNVQSLNNYASASVGQQRDMCQILERGGNIQNPSNVIVPLTNPRPTPTFLPLPIAPSTIVSNNTQTNTVSSNSSNKTSSFDTLFSGANFYGTVNINLGHQNKE